MHKLLMIKTSVKIGLTLTMSKVSHLTMLSPCYVFSILCNVHVGTISLVTFGFKNVCTNQ